MGLQKDEIDYSEQDQRLDEMIGVADRLEVTLDEVYAVSIGMDQSTFLKWSGTASSLPRKIASKERP